MYSITWVCINGDAHSMAFVNFTTLNGLKKGKERTCTPLFLVAKVWVALEKRKYSSYVVWLTLCKLLSVPATTQLNAFGKAVNKHVTVCARHFKMNQIGG